LHQDESGAMSIEKILILALISLPLLIILYIFRGKIIGYFQTQTTSLDQDAQQTPTLN
jgi:Flp pilus assembly pilin Flp